MDCKQSEGMVKQMVKQSVDNDELTDSFVKTALECLLTSGDCPADECLESVCDDYRNQQPIRGQTTGDKEETTFDIRTLWSSPASVSGDNKQEAKPEIKLVVNCLEEVDEYITEKRVQFENNSDSTQCSSIEADGSDSKDSGVEDKTVCVNSNERIKHPLKYHWQLWFWRADPGVKVDWEKALQRVCMPFESVEQFWHLYHHIIPVTQMSAPSDYCVFKEGIIPMWEDSRNINGGKWTLHFKKTDKREINPVMDYVWLEVLLCMIGEGFNEFTEDICGAVVNIRAKEDRISVWTANTSRSVANLKIGQILKIRTKYAGKMTYEAHSTAQRIALAKDLLFDTKSSTSTKSRSQPGRRSCLF